MISGGFGFAATAWAGAAMTVVAIIAVTASLRLHRSQSRVVARSSDLTLAAEAVATEAVATENV